MKKTDNLQNNRSKILIVDDDHELLDLLSDFFSRHDFEVDTAASSPEALTLLREKRYDIIILDLYLGRGDLGSEVCQKIRKTTDIPIIMLTSVKNDDEKITSFRAGIDNYVTKPCRNDVLLANVQAALKRTQSKKTGITSYHFLDWTFEPRSAILTDPKGKKTRLTDNLSDLLTIFLQYPQEILTRDQILNLAQGRALHDPFERTIDIQLSRLRRKLQDNEKMPRFIRTIRGKGYTFLPEVTKYSIEA